MQLRISYRLGIALGCLGWLLLAYPRLVVVYQQVASGQAVWIVYQAFYHGVIDFQTQWLALSLHPFFALLFLAGLYLDAAGAPGVLLRRILSGISATLLATTAAIACTVVGPPGGTTRILWAIGIFQFVAWIPLMVVFACRRAPLRLPTTELAAGLAGAAAAVTACIYLSNIVTGRLSRWSWTSGVIDEVGFALIVLFAIGMKRQAVHERHRETA